MPRPPGHVTAVEAEGGHEADEREESVENDIPAAFVDPIPRTLLEARGKVLEERVGEAEHQGNARKIQRTKNLLEITREQIKEVGGGSDGRRHFSLVNSNKKIQKLQKAQQKAHEELDEIAEEQDRLDERRKKGEINAEKTTRDLDNEKQRYAYLARQLECESRAQLREKTGLRRAVEVLRGVVQQAQRMDAVPELDMLETWAQQQEPSEYDEEKDPLLLGLEVSEEDLDSQGGELDTSSEPTEMEWSEAQRGKKRQWGEGRWTTAEDRDNQGTSKEAAGSSGSGGRHEAAEVGGKLEDQSGGRKMESKFAEVKQAVGVLQYVTEANVQIEEQERMQLMQEREIMCRQAARGIEAEVVGAPAPLAVQVARVPPNPRLGIEARKKRLAELRASSEGGRAGGLGRRRGGTPSRSSSMEVESKEADIRRKGRRRKEASRSPRGRTRNRLLGQ